MFKLKDLCIFFTALLLQIVFIAGCGITTKKTAADTPDNDFTAYADHDNYSDSDESVFVDDDQFLSDKDEDADSFYEKCGNGIVDPEEKCDGNLKNCVDINSQKYYAGKAKCLKNCSGFDVATCEENEILDNDNGDTSVPDESDDSGNTALDENDSDDNTDSDDISFSTCECLGTVYNVPVQFRHLEGWCTMDEDNDGIVNCVEAHDGNLIDSDGDGLPDYIDEDSDNDGLSDFQENDLGTDPLKTDSDGDLTDDLTEFIAGTDPADPESNIPEDSYYIVLPYESDQFIRNLDFDTYIKKVDVLIVIDLSGSMMEEHQNLKEGIKTTIIDGIKAEIPDIGFGLVEFGTLEDKVYKLKQAVTTNSDDVKSAVDSIMSCGGAEEYHTFVLYQSADGDGTSETICTEYMGIIGCSAGPYLINVPEVDCSGSEGNIGGACFRNESLPVIIMASDEAFANDTWYSWNAGTEKTSSIAVDAMNSINAKFIGIDSGSSMNDFDLISQGTGSTDESGNSFNSKINSDGTGLSEKIVESVLDLKQNIRMDIMAKAVHIDNTYGVANTTEFITNISPNAFENTKAGQIVTFEITFKNSFYENESNEAKVFSAKINILGDGTFFLGSKDVYILVPGKSG